MSAECKRLRGPDATGPDCGCRAQACALEIQDSAVMLKANAQAKAPASATSPAVHGFLPAPNVEQLLECDALCECDA